MADFTKINGVFAKDTVLRAGISDVQSYIGYSQADIYGLCADFENSTFTRLAGAVGKTGGADFSSIAPWSGMRRCVLADNGTVNAYYGEQGYVEDGTAGQVMVEIPKFYYRVVPLKLQPQSWDDYEATNWASGTSYAVGAVVIYDGAYYACKTANSDEEFTSAKWHEITELGLTGYHILKANYYISATPKDGFKIHPLFVRPDGTERAKAYMSAYEGCIYDVSASAYLLNDEQVVDVTAGTGDKLSSIGGTYTREYTYNDKATGEDVTITLTTGAKPVSGKTSSNNLTRHNCTVLAQNRGTGWQQQTIQLASAIQMLNAVEYASFNWQATLGRGVTSIVDNSVENCASFIGSTSALGNTSGNATVTIDYTGTARNTLNTLAISYRGIENFFGNISKWAEGVNIYGAYINGAGELFICTDNNFADDKTTDNYESVGFTVTNKSSFIKYFGYGSEKYDWFFVVSKTGQGANGTLPVGDYTSVTPCLNDYRICALGGMWNISGDYSRCGGFYTNTASNSNYRARSYSARLAYLA